MPDTPEGPMEPRVIGMNEQMPGLLRKIDDPWGVMWRVRNEIKRIDLGRTYRQQRARFVELHQERPVFIIGIPRSGTTSTYRVLAAHPGLRSTGYEGHDCWRRFHHPRRSNWDSDWVGRGQVTDRERSFVRRWWYARVGDGRFLDKTPDNAMRLPYLLDLFPDAHIVWVQRDPRPVLNSLINGWEQPLGRFRTYFVPEDLEIPGYEPKRQWCFPLPRGWRALKSSPIPDIVEEQYRQHNEGALSGRDVVPADQWHEVFFEDLVADPAGVTAALLARLDLPPSVEVTAEAERLRVRPVNTMRLDGPSDWREHETDVRRIIEDLRGLITESGYDVDALLAGGTAAPVAPDR